jgi:transketolase
MLDIRKYPRHNSMRGELGFELYKAMRKNKKIWILLPDQGYKLFWPHKDDFPERVIITGAAEQAVTGMAIGLALKGKIPFIFSLTPFVLFRNYEWVRNYIFYENIPVKLIGQGRGNDYLTDAYTHTAWGDKEVLSTFKNIEQFWPDHIDEVPKMVKEMITNKKPSFISLIK